jgi:hypothetical protein
MIFHMEDPIPPMACPTDSWATAALASKEAGRSWQRWIWVLPGLSCRFRWRIQIWLLRFGWESQRTRWSFGLARGQGSGFQSWKERIWESLNDGIRFPGFFAKKKNEFNRTAPVRFEPVFGPVQLIFSKINVIWFGWFFESKPNWTVNTRSPN